MNKVLLTILDGFGEGPDWPDNAIKLAHTPNIDKLRSKYPFGTLKCSGEAVGLAEGTMGGSEVGHFAIGAGRIVPQFLLDINNSPPVFRFPLPLLLTRSVPLRLFLLPSQSKHYSPS